MAKRGRREMVTAVRAGASLRAVARRFRVSLLAVQRWVERAGDRPLDEVAWAERPDRPHHTRRTDEVLEELVVAVRAELKTSSDLGEFGAAASRRELLTRDLPTGPAVRTIGRILERRGSLDGQRRGRRRLPPPGW